MERIAPNITTNTNTVPAFRPGDTVKVHYKIVEGGKVRIQPYEGIVIAIKGSGVSRTFTVRRIGADSVGVERIFPLYSPNIEKIEILKVGSVRRSKLYFLRERIGKQAMKIKDGTFVPVFDNTANESPVEETIESNEATETTEVLETTETTVTADTEPTVPTQVEDTTSESETVETSTNQ